MTIDVEKVTTINDLVKKVKEQTEKQERGLPASETGYGESKKTVLWYPHEKLGNRTPNSYEMGEDDKKGNTAASLLWNGCYHFEVYFPIDPEKGIGIDDAKFKEGTKELEEEYEKAGGGLGGAAKVAKVVAANFIGFIESDESDKKIQSSMQKIMDATLGRITGQLKDAYNKSGNSGYGITTPTPKLLYKGNLFKADIYLPINNYNINRASGILQETGVYTEISTAILSGAWKMVEQMGGQVAGGFKAVAGSTLKEGIAARVGSPNLETYDFSWDLYPRSEKEFEHIINILRFFQSISVPHFSRNDMFYKMPPVLTMEAFSKNLKNKKPDITIIRPKRQFYVTNIAVDFATENGTMLLNDEGYPFFMKLKLSLIKVDITTYDELFVNPYM